MYPSASTVAHDSLSSSTSLSVAISLSVTTAVTVAVVAAALRRLFCGLRPLVCAGLVWAGLGWSARSLSGRTNLASAAAVDSSPSPWSTGSHPPSSSSYPTPRPPPSSLPAVDRSLSGRIRRTTTRLRLHVPALPTSTEVVFQLTVSGDIIAVDW